MSEEREKKAEADTNKFIKTVMRPYLKFIHETPGLMSLLYDIDLLPEQIVLPINAMRLAAVCELWKRQKS